MGVLSSVKTAVRQQAEVTFPVGVGRLMRGRRRVWR
jgi:hypothetical protein